VAEIRIRQVDRAPASVVGDGRVEQERLLTVDEQLEGPQEPRAPHVEPELALRRIRTVPPAVGDEKRLLVLQDQSRRVGRGAGGANVVGVAGRQLVGGVGHHPT